MLEIHFLIFNCNETEQFSIDYLYNKFPHDSKVSFITKKFETASKFFFCNLFNNSFPKLEFNNEFSFYKLHRAKKVNFLPNYQDAVLMQAVCCMKRQFQIVFCNLVKRSSFDACHNKSTPTGFAQIERFNNEQNTQSK